MDLLPEADKPWGYHRPSSPQPAPRPSSRCAPRRYRFASIAICTDAQWRTGPRSIINPQISCLCQDQFPVAHDISTAPPFPSLLLENGIVIVAESFAVNAFVPFSNHGRCTRNSLPLSPGTGMRLGTAPAVTIFGLLACSFSFFTAWSAE